jgi:hypothetical protein
MDFIKYIREVIKSEIRKGEILDDAKLDLQRLRGAKPIRT